MALTQYDLSRSFWDFAFEHPDLITPTHAAIFFFAMEHCNRLGWKEKFGLPTSMVLDAIGLKSHKTYMPHFNNLVEWGFIKVVEYSKNQYSSNIIALSVASVKNTKALDKALSKHGIKHGQSSSIGTGSIDKQVTKNNEQVNNKQSSIAEFEKFWVLYDKPVGKAKCFPKFGKLSDSQKSKIFLTLPDYVRSTPDKKFRKNPMTYLNNECWNDEVIQQKPTQGEFKLTANLNC